ncbi:hypothetical protein BC830DRAFT_1037950, partial [Chytriomyces sp. MP71]
DAIVNPANSSLLGGGGVDSFIHQAAGPSLKNACKALTCDTGNAVITPAFSIATCKFVIHTVGPMEQNPEALKSCYRSSLSLLVPNRLKSIAFTCISTGVYGYPNDAAARIAISAVKEFVDSPQNKSVKRIIFCTYTQLDHNIYIRLIP